MKTNEIITTAKGMTTLLLSNEPVIKQNYEGEITVEINLQLISGYSKQFTITVCKYTGSLNLNSGVNKNSSFPVHLTESGRKVWEAFVDDCAKKLIEFIKTE